MGIDMDEFKLLATVIHFWKSTYKWSEKYTHSIDSKC